MNLFKQIRKQCKCKCKQHCDKCLLFKDGDCLLNRPPSEWNKHEIKKVLRKEK